MLLFVESPSLLLDFIKVGISFNLDYIIIFLYYFKGLIILKEEDVCMLINYLNKLLTLSVGFL